MKPAFLPISLTIPTPFSQAIAYVFTQLIALTDSWTAVSNPKDLSITGISLSIVLGIPPMLIYKF